MLCYFVEPGHGPLQSELERLRLDRVKRNERLAARLNELGLPITLDEVEASAPGSVIGRPHFASVLVARGAAKSIPDAFDRLLGKGAPAYVPKARLAATTVISLAKGSGAVAVLAHPLSLGLEMSEFDRVVGELANAELAGLECYYGRYSPEDRAGLAEIARRHGVVATGGSDFHGTSKPDLSVGSGTGDLDVPNSALTELEARRP